MPDSEIPSRLPNVNFLGVAGKESLDTKETTKPVERLEVNEIERFHQIQDFLKEMAPRHRNMYFGVTATSRKAAEVKAASEARLIISNFELSDNWSAGRGTAFKQPDERMKIKPRETFDIFDSDTDLRPDEYIVQVSASLNPW